MDVDADNKLLLEKCAVEDKKRRAASERDAANKAWAEEARVKLMIQLEAAEQLMVDKDRELAFILQKEETDLGALELETANLAARVGYEYGAGFVRGNRDKPRRARSPDAASLRNKLIENLQPYRLCHTCEILQSDGDDVCHICGVAVKAVIYDPSTNEHFRGFNDLWEKLVKLRKAQSNHAARGRELLKKAEDHRLECAAKGAPEGEGYFCRQCLQSWALRM